VQTEQIMNTQLPHPDTRPRAGASTAGSRLSRLAAVLSTVIGGLFAVAAAGPAAFARPVPPPGGSWATSVTPVVPATVQALGTGGMAGWQVALIAIGAAVVAAAAAIVLDRMLIRRRGVTAASA
jgi:hypothetical protein